MGLIKGDTGSLDYSLCGTLGSKLISHTISDATYLDNIGVL